MRFDSHLTSGLKSSWTIPDTSGTTNQCPWLDVRLSKGRTPHVRSRVLTFGGKQQAAQFGLLLQKGHDRHNDLCLQTRSAAYGAIRYNSSLPPQLAPATRRTYRQQQAVHKEPEEHRCHGQPRRLPQVVEPRRSAAGRHRSRSHRVRRMGDEARSALRKSACCVATSSSFIPAGRRRAYRLALCVPTLDSRQSVKTSSASRLPPSSSEVSTPVWRAVGRSIAVFWTSVQRPPAPFRPSRHVC